MHNNTRDDEQFTDLVNFLKRQTGTYDVLITRDTLLEGDLGVTGDDAEDLIIAFGKRYGVDVDNFYFTRYFYDEPGVLNYQEKIIFPFSVGHLEKAINAGRLDEEVINS